MASMLRRTITGSTIVLTNTVLSFALALIITLTLISTLTQSDYGILILAISAYGIFSVFLSFGVDTWIVAEIASYRGKEDLASLKKLLRDFSIFKIVVAIAISAAIFLLADYITIIYSERIAGLLQVVSGMVLLSGIRGLFQSVVYGYSRFFLYSSVPVIESASRIPLILLFVVQLNQGVYGALLAYLVAIGISTLVLSVFYSRTLLSMKKVQGSKEPLLVNMFKGHGKYVPINDIIKQICTRLPEWIINTFWDLKTVAVYGLAKKFYTPATELLGSIEVILLPALSEEISKNKTRFVRMYARATKYSLWLAILLVIPGILLAPIVLDWLVPENYDKSATLLQVLLLGLLMVGLTNAQRSAFFALKSQKYLFFSSAFALVVLIILAIPSVYYFGAMGMVVAEILYLLLSALFRFYLLEHGDKSLAIRPKDLFSYDEQDRNTISRVMLKVRSFARF